MTASSMLATAQVSHSIDYSSGTGQGRRHHVDIIGQILPLTDRKSTRLNSSHPRRPSDLTASSMLATAQVSHSIDYSSGTGQVRRHHVDIIGQILPVTEGEESRPVLLNEILMQIGRAHV